MQVKIYRPAGQQNTLAQEWKQMVADMLASRDLAKRLTIRDFKAQYRQSVLGVLWAFITPLLNTLVWIFLQFSGVVKVADTGIPFAAFVFSGTMLWSVLVESVNAPLLTTQQSKSIMGKINFPKEALLLSGLYKTLGNALIRMVLVLVALSALGVFPGFYLVLAPLFVIGLVLVGFTFGLLITPVGMLYNDVGRAIPLLLQFLMYASPVVYALPQQGTLAQILRINPLTPLIINARNAFTGIPFEQITYYIGIQITAAILFFAGWFFYRFSIPIIVERSSS